MKEKYPTCNSAVKLKFKLEKTFTQENFQGKNAILKWRNAHNYIHTYKSRKITSLKKGRAEMRRGDLNSVSNGANYLCMTLCQLLNHAKCFSEVSDSATSSKRTNPLTSSSTVTNTYSS